MENISCFEEVIKIKKSTIKLVLSQLTIIEIVKASMGASPQVNELLKNTFQNIDFNKEKTSIGSVRISEIESIHSKIVEMINDQK